MRPYYVRAGSGLTNNSALGKSSPPTGSGMAERSKTSSGAFYLWSAAARSAEKFFRAAPAPAPISEIWLAARKALELSRFTRAKNPPCTSHLRNKKARDLLLQP